MPGSVDQEGQLCRPIQSSVRRWAFACKCERSCREILPANRVRLLAEHFRPGLSERNEGLRDRFELAEHLSETRWIHQYSRGLPLLVPGELKRAPPTTHPLATLHRK